jgi:hypothetical protein
MPRNLLYYSVSLKSKHLFNKVRKECNKKGVSNFFTHKQEVKHGLLLSDSFMKKAIINKQKSLRAFVHSNRKNVGYSQSIEINQLREGNI